MKFASTTYTERSWAIDLIGHLKLLAGKNNRPIKGVGGELTINSDGGKLFPDVLLFGDKATQQILQGWELKLPDTSIDDYEFRQNAETKANVLGLNSFLLWNVSYARLYILDTADEFQLANEWNALADIATRASVEPNRNRWEELATEILGYLNDLFDNGTLEGRQFIDAYRSGGITSLIMENSGLVAESLTIAGNSNTIFKAEMVLWWEKYKSEYAGGKCETVLAQAVISNWIGKLLFAHILREKDERARAVATISAETSPQDALAIFQTLSEDCNFWTIFSNSIGLEMLPNQPWKQLKEFNILLTDLRVGSVDQAQLSSVLEATVEVALRKLRGQYTTPISLARLLVRLCVKNTMDDRFLDPCAGSGTIARAAMEQKQRAGVEPSKISASIFAGDQDPQAIQIATFALAKPAMMHMPLRLFERDAFTLSPDTEIEFRNPSNGESFSEKLDQFETIASNLPFVAQKGRKQYGNAIQAVSEFLGAEGLSLSGRTDVSAYLPFSLHPILKANGRLGIIITNAWLGTDWGDTFFSLLSRYYDLKVVVTSGAGRWFKNSEVVTNILIMEKKTDPATPSGDIKFVVLTQPIEEIGDEESLEVTTAQIELGQENKDRITIRSVSPDGMQQFRQIGLGGNAQFVNCDWVLDLPLTRVSTQFDIVRGERRGMNALFHPKGEHEIEPEYIEPLAKSLKDFKRLQSKAVKIAFCCSRTEEELTSLGHTGALAWIARFKTEKNIKKLSKTNEHWYEMKADSMSELVMAMGYSNRLFVARLAPKAFADQRLICFNEREYADTELCHALLNSTVGMFIIEGFGFGRGLGMLDLNKDRIAKYFHMLDPSHLSIESAKRVKLAFAPLLARDVIEVADELEQSDRQEFDDTIIDVFDLNLERDHLYENLRNLVEIRLTATT